MPSCAGLGATGLGPQVRRAPNPRPAGRGRVHREAPGADAEGAERPAAGVRAARGGGRAGQAAQGGCPAQRLSRRQVGGSGFTGGGGCQCRGPPASSAGRQSHFPRDSPVPMSFFPARPGAAVLPPALQTAPSAGFPVTSAGEGARVPGGVSCPGTRRRGCSARPAASPPGWSQAKPLDGAKPRRCCAGPAALRSSSDATLVRRRRARPAIHAWSVRAGSANPTAPFCSLHADSQHFPIPRSLTPTLLRRSGGCQGTRGVRVLGCLVPGVQGPEPRRCPCVPGGLWGCPRPGGGAVSWPGSRRLHVLRRCWSAPLAAHVATCQRPLPGSCPVQRLLPAGELPPSASSGGAGSFPGSTRR